MQPHNAYNRNRMPTHPPASDELLRIPCACASLRRASRVVTQLYEDAFRPFGVTAPQFTVLATLSAMGEMPHSRLSDLLAMDATTLSRVLQLMTRRGWLKTSSGTDRRQKLISLSEDGEALFARTKPVWHAVQHKLQNAFGGADWSKMFVLVDRVATGAQHVMEKSRSATQ